MREIPLSMLNYNSKATIKRIMGGRGLVRRLYELGFVPGSQVKIIFSESPGRVVVEVKGSRIALGRGILSKIIVSSEVEK